ncbi:MAG: rhomboid family intramembrane serine protease [Candidatus Aenigmarchaeota archaeon]|nr:rhomboid family intramembrane serine protease [Candidatus Aenigmarchaeota archaeon]
MENKLYSIWLVIICTIIFTLQIIFPQITDQFALYSNRVLYEPWLLVTSIFLHGSFEHLFFNMFALALFGIILESIIGSRNFLIAFFVSGIIASIGAAFFYPASLGASGAIYGIIGALTAIRPKMTVWVLGVPMPMFVAAVLWALIDLVGMFEPSGIANAAHLFGLASGVVVGVFFRRKFPERRIKEEPLSPEEEEAIDYYIDYNS